MIRKLLYGIAVSALFVFAAPANAQLSVLCVNCSEEVTDAIRWGESIQNQIQQIQNTINIWQNALINTANLPQRLFSDITGPIYRLQGLLQQSSMMSDRFKYMIESMSHPSGYGGSLEDIPAALAQLNNTYAMVMRQFGDVSQQVGDLSSQCSQQLAYGADGGFGAAGIKSATQAGVEVAATSAQCAELRFRLQQAAWNAEHAARLRQANREAMLDAATRQHLQSGIQASCSSLAAGGASSWMCQ